MPLLTIIAGGFIAGLCGVTLWVVAKLVFRKRRRKNDRFFKKPTPPDEFGYDTATIPVDMKEIRKN